MEAIDRLDAWFAALTLLCALYLALALWPARRSRWHSDAADSARATGAAPYRSEYRSGSPHSRRALPRA